MASLSSTSVSSSNSLGNTSLRGFGGMASGIDRDAIIEQMTLGTNTKIESQKSNMTKLQWKQEAYRGITDQILDLTDKYASYSSTSNLKDPGLFSKSLVTVHGPESATRFVTATGTSKLVENIAITAVKKLATATVRQSNAHVAGKLETGTIKFNGGYTDYSKLQGTALNIGTYDSRNMKFNKSWEFTFDSTYIDENGEKQTINYLNENSQELVDQLNAMAKSKGLGKQIQFELDANEKIQLKTLQNEGDTDTAVISTNSSALSALGFERSGSSKVINQGEFNTGIQKTFKEASVGQTNIIDSLAGQNLIFEYDGNQKSIQLITKEEVEELKKLGADDKNNNTEKQIEKIVSNIQGRLGKAFGTDTIKVDSFSEGTGDDAGYKLGFSTEDGHTVSILSGNDELLKTLGIDFGESNKVNVDGKLGQAALGLNADTYTNSNGQLDLVINGVSITGLNANSTVSDILSKINSTTAAGVKATYVDATGQFMLVSNETGAGRDITLDSALAEELFGGYVPGKDGDLVDEKGNVLAEKDKDDGKLYLIGEDGKRTGVVVDEYGRHLFGTGDNKDLFIGADNQRVNAAGYHVNAAGHLIDAQGRLINKDGNLVALDKDGNDRLIAVIDEKTGKAVEPSYTLSDDLKVDEEGKFAGSSIDELEKLGYEVKLINQDGHFVDINNNLVDQEGNQVDKDGYRLSKDRKYYVNGEGKNIAYHEETKQWYRINDDGNCIYVDESDNNKEIAVACDNGKWYRVDKDGYFITVGDDGKEYRIAKSDETDDDGNAIWYRVNDGYFADKDTNNRLVREKEGDDYVWYQIDENGYYIADGNGNEDRRVVKGKDEDGKDVWYLADKSGHYIDGTGERIVKEKNENDEDVWYQVGKNGYYLNEKGKEVKQEKDGKWYEVDARGIPIEGAEGVEEDPRVISDDGPVENERLKGERVKGERLALLGVAPKKENQVSSSNIMASDGPITTGVVKSDVEKVEGLAQNINKGQNAVIQVSYGNGVTVDMERSSNTFNLEGLTVTVTGTFGGSYKKDDKGDVTDTWEPDSSQTVTFSAKADVDKALETVKAFFEDFNALVTEINSQITARPDSNYGPLTSAQKEEMDETSIENWEKKAKQGILFNDDVMRDLSGSMEGVLSKLMNKYGVNYQDLEKIGITYSEDYLDGGTLVFDESKFRSAMESDPELVSKIISGGESGGKGLIHVVEDSLTPYATRYASKNGNSYGRLVEVAGTEKKPTTLMSNQIYKQLKEMQETIDKLQAQLKVEQDRYISQFTTMESLINQMNTQSSYLSQIMA